MTNLEMMSDKMVQDALHALRLGYSVHKVATAFHTTIPTFREHMKRRGYDVDELSKRDILVYDAVSEKWETIIK